MNAVSFLSVVRILPVRFTGIGVERFIEREINDTDRLGKTFLGRFFLSLVWPARACAQKSHGKDFVWQVDLFCFAILGKFSDCHLIFFHPVFCFPNVWHLFHIVVVARCSLLLLHIRARLQHQHAATTHARLPNLC